MIQEDYAVEVSNLTKKYDGFLLDHVSFQIPYGSIVGFIGENGAGKSTTIKAMLGLIPLNEGTSKILGNTALSDETDGSWKEEIGVVFDECNLPAELQAKDVQVIMKNIYKTWEAAKFQEYLTRFEIPFNRKIKELSKGMKMKLSIAVALCHNSKLLILDEGTSGLDPVVRNEILDIFQEFIEDGQHAVFLSSHITSDIEKVADYIMLIHKGKLLLTENKDDLIYQYGMVKCTKEQADQIDPSVIIGRSDNAYESSVLVNNRNAVENRDMVIDRVTIEEILLYVVKKEGR